MSKVYLILQFPLPEEYSNGNTELYAIGTSLESAQKLLQEANTKVDSYENKFVIQEYETDVKLEETF